MNKSTIDQSKLLLKIRKLNVLNKRQIAIKLLIPALKGKKVADNQKLFLEYAFLLYHVKLDYFLDKKISKNKTIARKNTNKAIKILRKIILLNKSKTDKNIILNAKIFLAQIYAIMNNPQAIQLAISNYKTSPNAITANRLADVYKRLGNIAKAKIWYKKYEILSKKSNVPKYIIYSDLAVIFKNLDNMITAKKYYKKALKLIPHNEVGNLTKKFLISNFLVK